MSDIFEEQLIANIGLITNNTYVYNLGCLLISHPNTAITTISIEYKVHEMKQPS